MKYLVTIVIVIYVIIAVVLVTLVLHYGNLAYQCNALVGFYCNTDWQCANVDGTKDGLAGTYDAAGNLITPDMLSCHLKGLYGVDPGANCIGFPTRPASLCVTTEGEQYIPDTNLYPCTEADNKGLCTGIFSESSNIDGVQNNSNSTSDNTPQAGMGFKVSTPFECGCYFGTNIIANSGTPAGNEQFGGSTIGGFYNIGAMACSRILDKYAPT